MDNRTIEMIDYISGEIDKQVKMDALNTFNRNMAKFGWEFTEEEFDHYIEAMMRLESENESTN